jgi:hypothetical protein
MRSIAQAVALRRLRGAAAGVVDRDADAREPIVRLLDGRDDGGSVADVEHEGQEPVTVFRLQRVERTGVRAAAATLSIRARAA